MIKAYLISITAIHAYDSFSYAISTKYKQNYLDEAQTANNMMQNNNLNSVLFKPNITLDKAGEMANSDCKARSPVDAIISLYFIYMLE